MAAPVKTTFDTTSHALSFCDSMSLASAAAVSREYYDTVEQVRISRLEDHSLLQRLMCQSSAVKNSLTGRAKRVELGKILRTSQMIEQLIARIQNNPPLYPLGTPMYFLDYVHAQPPSTKPIHNDLEKMKQMADKLSMSSLFLAGIKLGDQGIFESVSLQELEEKKELCFFYAASAGKLSPTKKFLRSASSSAQGRALVFATLWQQKRVIGLLLKCRSIPVEQAVLHAAALD